MYMPRVQPPADLPRNDVTYKAVAPLCSGNARHRRARKSKDEQGDMCRIRYASLRIVVDRAAVTRLDWVVRWRSRLTRILCLHEMVRQLSPKDLGRGGSQVPIPPGSCPSAALPLRALS